MKIALLGYGVEGESAYRYYSQLYPRAEFIVLDNAMDPKNTIPDNVEFRGGVESFLNIDADIVVRTPAVSPSKISSRGIVTSVTKEFFEKCPAPIIGVTGTKGKGTTCTLIAKMLEAAGRKVWLVGNIGVPALDIIDDVKAEDIVVYELSSFQLWDLEKSPETAVVLLIEPDHLNVHKDFEDYVAAKGNITRYQQESDFVIYHPTNEQSRKIALLSTGIKKRYHSKGGAYIKDDAIYIDTKKVCTISDVALPGVHNLENVCAAVTAVWSYTKDIDAIAHAIRSFTGLPHHIEKVREFEGVAYYDDSYSSAFAATLAAVKSFTQPVILIVGGFDRGIDVTSFVEQLTQQQNLKRIVAVGQTRELLVPLLYRRGMNATEVNGSMDIVVKTARREASPGDIVLLSPGFASFDQYKNFVDRGEKFQKEVESL